MFRYLFTLHFTKKNVIAALVSAALYAIIRVTLEEYAKGLNAKVNEEVTNEENNS